MHQYRCGTCAYAQRIVEHYEDGDINRIFCNKINRDIDLLSCDLPHWFFDVGCASHSEFICQGGKVMNAFISLIISEMVYDDGDMYYKVSPEKYIEVLGRMVTNEPISL